MTLAKDPQHSFEEIKVEDVITDGETVEELLGAIETWSENKEAAQKFNKATRDIKRLCPFDGKEQVYRLNGFTLSTLPTPGGTIRKESVTEPGHRIKIDYRQRRR